MARPAIQLYSLREVDQPLPALLDRIADAGFEGVEFAYRVGDADVNAVVETLDDRELTPVAAHVPIDRLEDDPSAEAAFYRELGCERLVVPHLDAENFESTAAVARAADRLEAVADDIAGLDLLYHNHQQEFVDLGDRTAFEQLIEATDDRIGFELDVGHAALAGADSMDLLHRYGDRIPIVHFRDADFDTGEWVTLGEGDVDLAGIGMAAREPGTPGVDWAIYEQEGDVSMAGLDGVVTTIRELATHEDREG